MNKYQEAFNELKHIIKVQSIDFDEIRYKKVEKYLNLLSELVDKATPKKPIRFKNSIYISNPKCPICKTTPHTGNQKYCDECGQALEVEDDNYRTKNYNKLKKALEVENE